MRAYCFHTAAYQELMDQWFRPSAVSEYELFTRCSAAGRHPDGQIIEYRQHGWLPITQQKVDFILDAVQHNWGEAFLFSDPDVQFLGPTRVRLLRLLGRKDLLFQRDSPSPHSICTGFFVCRSNFRTLTFWRAVRARMDEPECGDGDQDAARALLVDTLVDRLTRAVNQLERRRLLAAWMSQHRLNAFKIGWRYLPVEFFGGGTLTGQRWQPGVVLPVPDPVLVHHANWTHGAANKVAQLHYVREVVDLRRR